MSDDSDSDEWLDSLSSLFDSDESDFPPPIVTSVRDVLDNTVVHVNIIPYGTTYDKYKVFSSLRKKLMKERKKPRNRRCRMIMSDVRNFTARMFVNVINSCDLNLYLGLFQQFYTPNIKMNFKKYMPAVNPLFETTVYSPDVVANFWYTIMNVNFDTIITLSKEKVITQGEQSCLLMTFQYTGTKMYNVSSVHDVLPNMIVESPSTSSSSLGDDSSSDGNTTQETKPASTEDIVESLDNMLQKLSLRKKPISVLFEGELIMHFNEQQQVKSMNVKVRSIKNDFEVEN